MAKKKNVTPTEPIVEETGNVAETPVEEIPQEVPPTALEIAEKAFNDGVAVVELALKEERTEDAIKAVGALKDLEDKYAEESRAVVFDELCRTEDPVVEVIKKFTYTAKKHRVKNDKEGVIKSIEVVDKEVEIPLYAFFKHADIDLTPFDYVSKLNQLLCLRTARELGYTKEELKNLGSKYFLRDAVKKIELGETPDSTNQICKLLQKTIDKVVYRPEVKDGEETGKNMYKCNNHDVAYLLALYTKKGKEALSVNVAKDTYLRTILMSVLHRIVCGLRYTATGFKESK